MGRGLSRLQKWILKTIEKREKLVSDTCLTEFYDFEKRIIDDGFRHTRNYDHVVWWRNGEKIDTTDWVGKTSETSKARQAFYHSIQNLKKRGLITGSVNYGLYLTSLGHAYFTNLSVKNMLSLIDRQEAKS